MSSGLWFHEYFDKGSKMVSGANEQQANGDDNALSACYTDIPPVGTVFFWRVDDTQEYSSLDELHEVDTRSIIVADTSGNLFAQDMCVDVDENNKTWLKRLAKKDASQMFRTQVDAIRAGLKFDEEYYREKLEAVLELKSLLDAE